MPPLTPVQSNRTVQTSLALPSSGRRFLIRRVRGIRRIILRLGRRSLIVILVCLVLVATLILLGIRWHLRLTSPIVESNWVVRHIEEKNQVSRSNFLLNTTAPTRDPKKIWAGAVQVGARYLNELRWHYGATEKAVPYVGHPEFMKTMELGSRQYVNSLACHVGADEDHQHGLVGRNLAGESIWQPAPLPPPIDKFPGGRDMALKNGGFYLDLSNALPLDRKVTDGREKVCRQAHYDLQDLPDASVVITFFNEPLSTLLRTVHSVLNYSPPPILREIILVDDHSDHPDVVPGGPLYEFARHLPKVKIMRLPEREGIVRARVAGAKAASGEVFLVLDSHIEVNPGWLEPQLARIRESPQTIVFPQILSLTHDTFSYKTNSGIGCFLSFRWSVVEQATIGGTATNVSTLPSPSMAGGLFAVDRDWFFELGGYDEGFIAWGAENVEMALRAWMCGGRVECAPCAKTYHIYRKGGAGYTNPPGALWVNRKRTARVWFDEHYQVAAKMIDVSAGHGNEEDVTDESLINMLELKERLKCKDFNWYLDNVDPTHDMRNLSDVIGLGRIQSPDNRCIDASNGRTVGAVVKSYPCHRPNQYSGSQGFFITKADDRIRVMANDKRCLSFQSKTELKIEQCSDRGKSPKWEIIALNAADFPLLPKGMKPFKLKWDKKSCLSLDKENHSPSLVDCQATGTVWFIDQFVPDPNFQLPSLQKALEARRSRKLRRRSKKRKPLTS